MHYFVRITIIDYCALIPQNERINIADRRSSILAVTRRDGTASATDLVDTLGFAVPTIWRNRYRNERLELGHSAAALASGALISIMITGGRLDEMLNYRSARGQLS